MSILHDWMMGKYEYFPAGAFAVAKINAAIYEWEKKNLPIFNLPIFIHPEVKDTNET